MDRSKKYLRVLVKFGLYSAVLGGLLMSLKMGVFYGTLAGVIFGICFSIIMSLIFIPVDFLATRGYPPEALNIRQTRTLQIKGDFNTIFEECSARLRGLKFIRKLTPHREEMSISARTKLSLASFGENIQLEFQILEKDTIRIRISSQSLSRYTELDFGRNYRNVERIKEKLAAVCNCKE